MRSQREATSGSWVATMTLMPRATKVEKELNDLPIRAPDLLDSALRFRERDPVECRVLDGVGSGTNQLFLSNGHPDGARSSGPPEGGSL